MINSDQFAKRLEKVIDYYGETASSFSEKIGVQRSSISHILSGRNKPSLDFVLKVLGSFPEVDLYWLMNGKGTFPAEPKSSPTEIPSEKISERPHGDILNKTSSTKKIDRIIIFYKDGSFENFDPLG